MEEGAVETRAMRKKKKQQEFEEAGVQIDDTPRLPVERFQRL